MQRGLWGQNFCPSPLELTLVLSGTQYAVCLFLRHPHALSVYLQCSEWVCGGLWAQAGLPGEPGHQVEPRVGKEANLQVCSAGKPSRLLALKSIVTGIFFPFRFVPLGRWASWGRTLAGSKNVSGYFSTLLSILLHYLKLITSSRIRTPLISVSYLILQLNLRSGFLVTYLT